MLNARENLILYIGQPLKGATVSVTFIRYQFMFLMKLLLSYKLNLLIR